MKKLKGENGFLQFVQLKSRKAFFVVRNTGRKPAVYEFGAFGEQDFDQNPVAELFKPINRKTTIIADQKSLLLQPIRL